MKKLSRIELRDVKGGVAGPPPGGGPVYCYFVSAACGNICADITQPTGPLPPVSTCTAYLAYFNPSCHYTYQAGKCGGGGIS